ncbi:stage V sporulation protein R [Bacillus thuringiensis serovar finitimus]|uniref:Stage V sporulation protein R n=2 Tax=Bacillus thuringiensis TaxID=1428 RepID=A0A243GAR5_BACTF|nr:stage V sporulation protein R [Bacillus thuringiensis serovar finitimus]
MDLTSDEAIEFAKLNAGVVQPSKTSINPYYLGIKMFEDIEERYNNPTEEMKRRGVKPGSGRDKIFEVREIEWDVSFLRNYLKNGELYIKHSYEGIELDLKYLEKVLPYLHQLWGRTVHMESIVESKGVVFSYDGKMVHRKYV